MSDRMAPAVERVRVEIHGAVQGVGFRPFVYRLAADLSLAGWVINDSRGVFIEVEGPRPALERFLQRVPAEKPPRSIIHSLETEWLPPAGYERFEIRHSQEQGAKTVLVLPDIATCDECLAEVLNPENRRYGYPFTNCTNCGPRFTIIEALPYDRPNTSMRAFTMCPDCQAEYDNPLDRRFHAQPNACPVCGPRLVLLAPDGTDLAETGQALQQAAQAIREGQIVAVKGLGGFHLVVDATNTKAVARLRRRKAREEKPLALMARDLNQARNLVTISPAAEAILTSPEAPIVLLPRREGAAVAGNVAPDNPNLGVMLPYTPLHHLLLRALTDPIVATSGNLSDEPICIDQAEALDRLGGIADLFLVHNRPIVRHADDSVAWLVNGEMQLLRRARGYAPLPVMVERRLPTLLAVGAHLKNTVALSVDRQVFISQHIGDLETAPALSAFERVIADFLRLYEAQPAAIAHDAHPDYLSTHWALDRAAEMGLPLVAVQHHHAHLAACLADAGASGPALGVIWDGTGYGSDGTVWGGEFLLGDAAGFERVGQLRPFRLPGGDKAVREPRRTAFALLWQMYGDEILDWDHLAPVASFSRRERELLARLLARGFNAPVTSSAGRLFDGVASLVGLRQKVNYEGQAAIELEYAAETGVREAYPLPLVAGGSGLDSPSGAGQAEMVLDWGPLLVALLDDLRRQVPPGIMSAKFHNALVEAITLVVCRVGQNPVALSGGCFQNRRLTENLTERLGAAGFEVLVHRQVPPNDGGISLGQLMVAAARLQGRVPEANNGGKRCV